MKKILNYPSEFQKHVNWCWAAVAIGVARHYDSGFPDSQCKVVNQELRRNDCCNGGSVSSCNVPAALDAALYRINHLRQFYQGFFCIHSIEVEIERLRPIGIRIVWDRRGRSSVGHFCTIIGVSVGQFGMDRVVVEDPDYGRSIVPFDSLLGQYHGCGTWDYTYETI